MATAEDGRFRRLAAAIAGDADPGDHIPGLELDVSGRTFTYQVRGDGAHPKNRRVTVLPHVLTISKGIGKIASEAWGEELSDEDGWLRLTLVNWDESAMTTAETDAEWWTFGAGRGIAPVPPWQADDYLSAGSETSRGTEPVDLPASRPRPRRKR